MRKRQEQKRVKLPTAYKGGEKCKTCKAIIIHRYDYFNNVYLWACSGCGATRYDKAAKFETRFQQASEIK